MNSAIRCPSDRYPIIRTALSETRPKHEAFNSLFKAELIRNRHKGPWRGIDDLEIAVAEYIDWFNHRRIHGEIGYVPPAEYEAQHTAVEPAPESVDDLIDAR